MTRIAVIGTHGGWSSEMLTDTVASLTGTRLLVDMEEVCLDLEQGKVFFDGLDLSTMDAILVKKIGGRYSPDLLDRLEILRFLEKQGVRIFSSPRSIMRVLDRLSCTVTLSLAGIPLPATLVTESIDRARKAVADFGEAVFKPLYTSKARGMTLIRDDSGASEAIARFKRDNPIMYIQKRVELPNQDLGIVFLGGSYLTTYARRRTNSAWNTTTRTGGTYAPYQPAPEIIELARKAQAMFDLDFTCVDVAETAHGPLVFEVSAFGGFRGITQTSHLDPARLLVAFVLEEVGA